MNYAILLKTVVNADGKTNSVEKVPYEGAITLKSMYELCECEYVDINWWSSTDNSESFPVLH